ncbi:MAG TPA: hypothetical protein VF618_19180 [Thermoanaerobaculia bacterium]
MSLLFSALTVSAATIKPVDLAELVDGADLIFVGTVIGMESVPVRDGSFAYTYVTFDVEQTLKGIPRSGKTITLRFAGGQAGDSVYEVSGTPRFADRGRHLLFVEGNDQLTVPLVGRQQGKLDIVPHPHTQEPIVVDDALRAVDGVKENGWRRGGLRLNRDGTLRASREGVRVISQEGVHIELEPETAGDAREKAAPLGSVLGELRSYIAKRKASSPQFRGKQFTESASKNDVPASLRFEHGRVK